MEWYEQLSAWIAEKQPVRVKTYQGEAVVLPVKLYQDTRKQIVRLQPSNAADEYSVGPDHFRRADAHHRFL